jgi:hypothetical protein
MENRDDIGNGDVHGKGRNSTPMDSDMFKSIGSPLKDHVPISSKNIFQIWKSNWIGS